MNCKEYQDDLKRRAQNDEAARQTQQFLEVNNKKKGFVDWRGGVLASWLVRSSVDRVCGVRALAGDIVLCSWATHFTLTEPLSTQVYKWVPANFMLGGNPSMDQHPIKGGAEILLVASCNRNRNKLRPDALSHLAG